MDFYLAEINNRTGQRRWDFNGLVGVEVDRIHAVTFHTRSLSFCQLWPALNMGLKLRFLELILGFVPIR
jgi:hypothetical protein